LKPKPLNILVILIDITGVFVVSKTEQLTRYPRLDTVLMVERFIKEHSGEFRKRKLWESLPKKMMYQTFCTTVDYLFQSGKIAIDKERKIGWIYNPELVRKYLARNDLSWSSKNETSLQNKVR